MVLQIRRIFRLEVPRQFHVPGDFPFDPLRTFDVFGSPASAASAARCPHPRHAGPPGPGRGVTRSLARLQHAAQSKAVADRSAMSPGRLPRRLHIPNSAMPEFAPPIKFSQPAPNRA